MLSWCPWTAMSMQRFQRIWVSSSNFILCIQAVHSRALLFSLFVFILSHFWIAFCDNKHDVYPQCRDISSSFAKDIHKCKVFDFTLVCRFKGFELTATEFICHDSCLLFFFFMYAKKIPPDSLSLECFVSLNLCQHIHNYSYHTNWF